eukprot:TRINITY_DN14150_c0_g1_i1.p1 TRINITY_DN14150_c0_g1~~TRINITY_DN14150_c0_g1_i1.p1  ORF type:complete len:482 (-),score=80.10 TRINITY_DN14150_c0_g1_i1:8-1417(-)
MAEACFAVIQQVAKRFDKEDALILDLKVVWNLLSCTSGCSDAEVLRILAESGACTVRYDRLISWLFCCEKSEAFRKVHAAPAVSKVDGSQQLSAEAGEQTPLLAGSAAEATAMVSRARNGALPGASKGGLRRAQTIACPCGSELSRRISRAGGTPRSGDVASASPTPLLQVRKKLGEGSSLQMPLRLGKELGAGTSGAVFDVNALGASDGRDYALKVVPCNDPEQRCRRLAEARLHARLGGHPAMVRYSCSWLDDARGSLLILMERCEEELWSYVVEGAAGASITEVVKVTWALQLAEGLHHIQTRQVMHRDLSPWNIFVSKPPSAADGQAPPTLKIGDFGMAVQMGPSVATPLRGMDSPDGEAMPLDESAIGSLFSAPELGQEYDASVDIYSLGMVIFFIWDSPRDVDSLITRIERLKETAELPDDFLAPQGLRSALQRMLSHDPTCRLDILSCLQCLRLLHADMLKP